VLLLPSCMGSNFSRRMYRPHDERFNPVEIGVARRESRSATIVLQSQMPHGRRYVGFLQNARYWLSEDAVYIITASFSLTKTTAVKLLGGKRIAVGSMYCLDHPTLWRLIEEHQERPRAKLRNLPPSCPEMALPPHRLDRRESAIRLCLYGPLPGLCSEI
jgi:hypothetical protein